MRALIKIEPQPKEVTGGWEYEGEYYHDMEDHLFNNVYGGEGIGTPLGGVYSAGGDKFTACGVTHEVSDVGVLLLDGVWYWQVETIEGTDHASP